MPRKPFTINNEAYFKRYVLIKNCVCFEKLLFLSDASNKKEISIRDPCQTKKALHFRNTNIKATILCLIYRGELFRK